MRATLAVALAIFCLFSGNSAAQENLALDGYTCADFLRDSNTPADGGKVLKSLMMISWATGYAAALQQKAARADASAIVLIAGALGQACREDPSQRAVQVTISTISHFVASPPTVGPTSPSPTANSVAYVDGFSLVENHDLPGNDLRHIERVDRKVCATTCKNEPLCKAYSFDKWNRWCFLKKEVAPLSLDPSSITGVRSELGNPVISDAPIRFDMRTNKKLLTSSYRTTSVSSLEDCQNECTREDRCRGTTFIGTQRSCQLFEAIETIAPDKGAVSSVKTQTPP